MATANIANTKVVPTETTALPYYDDFDESKNFHRILFRLPSYKLFFRTRSKDLVITYLRTEVSF